MAPSKLLTMGEVVAVLGLTRDQVRHHVRMGRLEPTVDWGDNTWRQYSRECIADFAEKAGITPAWDKLTPTHTTETTDSRVTDDASLH